MKKKARGSKNRPVKYDRMPFWRRLLEMVICAVLAALVVELFNQTSLVRMLEYLKKPQYFAINCLVILFTLSLSELFRHRRAMRWTLTALWMALGIANYMVVRHRTLPIAGGDLLLTRENLGLATTYYSWLQILSVLAASVALIAGIAWLFTHTPRCRHMNYVFGLCVVSIMALLLTGTNLLCIKAGVLPDSYPDRVNAYRDYGFTTCFAFTFGQRGIEKPEEYSTETVEQILDEVQEEPTAAEPKARFDAEAMRNPNIVFVQLESFFDVDTMRDTRLSGDPMPNYHALLHQWPNAQLYVPTVGGGTANVEFEVMSGMNLEFFGAGETPYNTIIQKEACETIAHTLRGHGYASTAIHNNTGTFFSRNQAYANLGYDRFLSLEYMHAPEYNRTGWAKDSVLTGEILHALETTRERDLIFAIGVESHGKYSDVYTPESGDIQVISTPEELKPEPLSNYVNLIRSVDDFLADLLAAFESYHEPIVAVIYGDHLPGLGLAPEMLTTGDLYAVRYLIWNNFGAEFEVQDMQAYRLSADLLRQLGITDGTMTRFHQAFPAGETGSEYMEKLKILEYDMLYGDKEIYGEAGAPEPTRLQMGVDPIELESAVLEYGRILVSGGPFTEFSVIMAGEEALDTVFLDGGHIAANVSIDQALNLDENICVAQCSYDGTELSRTASVTLERRNMNKDMK